MILDEKQYNEIMAEYFSEQTLSDIGTAAIVLRRISSDSIGEIASDIADKVGKRFACYCSAKYPNTDIWYCVYEEAKKWYVTHAKNAIVGVVKSVLTKK